MQNGISTGAEHVRYPGTSGAGYLRNCGARYQWFIYRESAFGKDSLGHIDQGSRKLGVLIVGIVE